MLGLFIESLGVPLNDLNLPRIKKLVLTAPDGSLLEQELPLGGFGISRYCLDGHLSEIAIAAGVHLVQETRVLEVKKDENFVISFQPSGWKVWISQGQSMCCCLWQAGKPGP
jgi:flavin-dependent dehydrogenase